MKSKTLIKILILLILSFALSFIPYTENESVINTEFLLTCAISLFGIALAILALLFTVIDRYKEKVEANIQDDVLQRSLPILKNISDDVLSILLITIVLFVTDLLREPLRILQTTEFFKKISLERAILITVLVFLLIVTFDITIVISKLIKGLFSIPIQTGSQTFNLSMDEQKLILASRNLSPKYARELIDYIKTLIIKQEIDKKK